MRRPATISGLCAGPAADRTFNSGERTIELFVDRCDGFDQDFQVITGYWIQVCVMIYPRSNR